MGVKVLYIAEIVGKAGVYCLKTLLPLLRQELGMDMVIANADGATGGYGLGKNHAMYLRKLGVDVVTAGDCVFYKKDLVESLDKSSFVIRAANLSPESPGRGYRVREAGNARVAVVSLMGQSGFPRIHASNPFIYLTEHAPKLETEARIIIVDFHAATTAEKRTMAYQADGLVSAVIGSHARVQTRDEEILPQGTAYITDAGRTGSALSVGGMDGVQRIREFRTQMPEWSQETWAEPELQGVLMEFDLRGKATRIERIRRACPLKEAPREGESLED
jgi:2',3'-cyclic-nucleotide 2'-phosphodiesterase